MINRTGDRQVLAALAAHGSDLTKPAHTIHFFYFKTIDAANAAADELKSAGYANIRAHRAPVTSLWERFFGPKLFSCIAETHAVPAEPAVFATTDWMNALAVKLGGEYDGWEASVEK
jgi:hypothetical protein